MGIKQRIYEAIRVITTYISPELNTRMCYKVRFGRKLDLNRPQTLNEKILWLKLNTYMNNPLIKQCADKYRVREYIVKKGCSELLNDVYGVYDSLEDIDWDKLPSKFVIKFNTGWGANLVCIDKGKLDLEKTSRIIKSWFKCNFYAGYSQMQYKDVEPKIIIEKFLGDEKNNLPEDYKFMCINGKAEYVMVCIGRGTTNTKYCLYDRQWNWHKFDKSCPNDPLIAKPTKIDEAFEYADLLSSEFPFVRTDLYIIGENIYFGELTFTPCAGLDNAIFPEVDKAIGDMIKL